MCVFASILYDSRELAQSCSRLSKACKNGASSSTMAVRSAEGTFKQLLMECWIFGCILGPSIIRPTRIQMKSPMGTMCWHRATRADWGDIGGDYDGGGAAVTWPEQKHPLLPSRWSPNLLKNWATATKALNRWRKVSPRPSIARALHMVRSRAEVEKVIGMRGKRIPSTEFPFLSRVLAACSCHLKILGQHSNFLNNKFGA